MSCLGKDEDEDENDMAVELYMLARPVVSTAFESMPEVHHEKSSFDLK